MTTAFVFPAFMMGVLGSAHCALMCGGVASTACGRPSATLGFNVGRIATYTVLGALAGAFGAVLPVAGVALRPLAAVALVGLGLHLAGITHVFANVERLGTRFWSRLAPLAQRARNAALLGAIWGCVPCGLVYTAIALAASAGTPLAGGLTMFAFGLGTAPMLGAIGLLGASAARLLVRPVVRRTAGVVVLLLGVHQTSLAFASANLSLDPQAHLSCHARRGRD